MNQADLIAVVMLRERRKTYEGHLRRLEAQAAQLEAAMARKRGQIAAVQRCIAAYDLRSDTAKSG